MPYTIKFTARALRDLTALDRIAQVRVRQQIDRLAENPFPPGAKKLHAEEPFFRIRAGDYRIIYSVEGRELLVIIVKIGHRKDVYR
ncbi:MAG: type II toxin-antitoxin system RelE/ParE family toxin [Terriglobia bacterium]|jgi:mRNA interferase RelE/StbE